MTRKQFLSTTGGALAPRLPAMAAAGRPKNVVVLISDQHRPGAMGWLGDPYSRTPHLDELARSSMAFRSAYCANPVCGPSRASLVTGLYTHNHGVNTNDIPWRGDLRTMGHYFSSAGYLTGLIGKAHFADGQSHGFDYRLDFNDWYQYLGPKTQLYVNEITAPNGGCGLPQVFHLWESGDPWKGRRNTGAEQAIVVGRPSLMKEGDHFDNFVARESARFLKRYAGKQPLFLIASFLKPHAPFTPAERFIDPNWPSSVRLPETYGKADLDSVPKYVGARITRTNQWTSLLQSPEAARKRLAMYYASVAHMDDCAGQVLGALPDEDTIVVYTADHGDMCGEHGLWDKMLFYDSSAGVPLIVRAPGVTRAGSVSTAPVSQVALLPTLLELCGIAVPKGLDDRSFAPLLRDPSGSRDLPVFSEMFAGSSRTMYMVRHGDWKYCWYPSDRAELYNLAQDPVEMNNLAGSSTHQAVVERLHGEIRARF